MRTSRPGLWLALCAAATGAGCQQAAVSPSAQLLGLRDMVRVGNYIVATSTERDELRVLSLETGNQAVPRRYVRAPNPIAALAVPVLRRPTSLVTDVAYVGSTEVLGPYVYASSPGLSQISIVWAQNTDQERGFTELKRLSTIAPVTAMAAQGGAPVADGSGALQPTPQTLYFATYDGVAATLFRFDPAPPDQLVAQAAVPVPIQTPHDQAIIDLVTLPGGRLAVATRGNAGGPGRAVVLDAATGNKLVDLKFPGPVRALYTHPAFTLSFKPDGGAGAGARIYGILDEGACGSAACGGVVAVDADTGERSLSLSGERLSDPTIPRSDRVAPVLTFGSGVIQSLALGVGSIVALPPSVTGAVSYVDGTEAMLGVVSMSNGQLGFFRAAELQQLNTLSSGPTASIFFPDGGPEPVLEDGGRTANSPRLVFGNGAVRDQTVIAVGNGVISGLGALTPVGSTLSSPVSNRAEPGDRVGGCEDGGTATVSAVQGDTIQFVGDCHFGGLASVRAGAAHPYVVVGTVSGYIGRAGPGQTVNIVAPYQHHYVDFDPRRPAVGITFPAEPVLGPEERFTIEVDDGYAPLVMTLTSTACSAGFTTLPGTVLADPTPSRQRIFIGYPSANGIVELNPSFVRRLSAAESGLLCWR